MEFPFIDQRWLTSVKTLVPVINKLHSKPKQHGIKRFLGMVDHLQKNRGKKETLKTLKSFRLFLQRAAIKQSNEPLPFRKTDRSGFPKILRFWKIKPETPTCEIRYIMSFWRILETFRLKPEYQVSSIVDKTTPVESLVNDIKHFIKSWRGLKLLGSEPQPNYPVLSNKAGPNGPATASALKDLNALKADKPLCEAVKQLIYLHGPTNVEDCFYMGDPSGKRHSKLVLLSDRAGKTRTVAIADWWSNTSLSGIHKSFLQGLRRLKTDVTYRQGELPKLLEQLGNSLFSADMTCFTDYFPIELEEYVVSQAYGDEVGRLWKQVIQERIFQHPKGDVKYASGNPMGLLSSWPVSAFTHHAIKQWCAFRLRKRRYKYLILGDDSLDTDKEVYQLYLQTMSKLGVPTSLSKCTQSESACAEFAKRLFCNSIEVTGLPVTLLEQLVLFPHQLIELVRIARERGYEDNYLAPGLLLVISSLRDKKILLDILSLPEPVTGTRPLWDVNPGTWAEKFSQLPEEDQKKLLSLAREKLFWDRVCELQGSQRVDLAEQADSPETQFTLALLLESYSRYLKLYKEKGEFSIWEAWMEGDYLEMANIPSPKQYHYPNKAAYAAECKYDTYKIALAFASDTYIPPIFPMPRYSNLEILRAGVGDLKSLLAFKMKKSLRNFTASRLRVAPP